MYEFVLTEIAPLTYSMISMILATTIPLHTRSSPMPLIAKETYIQDES